MKIKIDTEGGGLLDALEYAAGHVIVKRADLDKIKAWARRKGLLRELKALGIEMQEIEVPGHWSSAIPVLAKPISAAKKPRRRAR